MRCAPLPEFLREGAHPVGLAPERPPLARTAQLRHCITAKHGFRIASAACTGTMPGLRPRPVLTLSSFFFCSVANAMCAAFSSAGESARGGMVSLREPAAARCGSGRFFCYLLSGRFFCCSALRNWAQR